MKWRKKHKPVVIISDIPYCNAGERVLTGLARANRYKDIESIRVRIKPWSDAWGSGRIDHDTLSWQVLKIYADYVELR